MNRETPLRSPKTTPMLPPELWSHIFQFLIPNDLFSVMNTCPEWNELLEENKNTFLLPLILPNVMKYVDLNTSLNFRKISKPAKLEVDKTLQSFTNSDDDNPFGFHYQESNTQRHLRKVTLKISRCYYLSSSRFRLFLAQVLPDLTAISCNSNPFLLGHIEYRRHPSTQPHFLSRNHHVACIMPKFGHHISSLVCNVFGNSTRIRPYFHFASYLQQLPNLRRLAIKIVCYNSISTHLFPCLQRAAYDFPPLPKLVLLDVSFKPGDRESISPFVLEMLKAYSQQLTALTCRTTLFVLPALNLEVLNESFPNLKKFHLLGERPEIPVALNKLSNVSWRLEKLHLEEIANYHREIWNPGDVLPMIYNFHDSLVHLDLNCHLKSMNADKAKEFEERKVQRHMTKLKILIPNPRNLKLQLFRSFLQESCSSLEEIHFETNGEDVMLFREEGRWALEHIRSLDKVVIWNNRTNLSGGDDDELMKYTMRRIEKKGS